MLSLIVVGSRLTGGPKRTAPEFLADFFSPLHLFLISFVSPGTGRSGPLTLAEERNEEMKCFHIHIASKNLEESSKFYSTVFNKYPDKVETDYLEWVLPEVEVLFSVSRGESNGFRSLGMLFEDGSSLTGEHERIGRTYALEAAETSACCHAQTDAFWLKREGEVPWMFFLKTGAFKGLGAVAPAVVKENADKSTKTSCCN
jgi:hypothetical protein